MEQKPKNPTPEWKVLAYVGAYGGNRRVVPRTEILRTVRGVGSTKLERAVERLKADGVLGETTSRAIPPRRYFWLTQAGREELGIGPLIF